MDKKKREIPVHVTLIQNGKTTYLVTKMINP